MTLYLKYRPQKIAELDLTDVRETLLKIVESGNIPHAFLFSGTKGSGKTSSARILAKVINCESKDSLEPCNVCSQCMSITNGTNIDVVEMDAASNRGIDDVRILRENVKLAPVTASKKIYIIDEAHMLTTEAANALLKTLEEPPEHVVFILATTNPEKLPPTIHSRLVNINFRKASKDEILQSLSKVIKGEKIEVDQGSLEAIIKVSDGSFRDAVKILEQVWLKHGKVNVEVVEKEFSGQGSNLATLISLISSKNLSKSLEEIEKISNSGISIKVFCQEIEKVFYSALLSKKGLAYPDLPHFSESEIIGFLEDLNNPAYKQSAIGQLALQIAISKLIKPQNDDVVEKKMEVQENKKIEEANPIEATKVEASKKKDSWEQVLTILKDKNTSLETVLRSSSPQGMEGNTFKLGVYYEFHKERIESGQNRKMLEDIFSSVYQNSIKIECILREKPVVAQKPEKSLTEAKQEDIIKAAKEIFG